MSSERLVSSLSGSAVLLRYSLSGLSTSVYERFRFRLHGAWIDRRGQCPRFRGGGYPRTRGSGQAVPEIWSKTEEAPPGADPRFRSLPRGAVAHLCHCCPVF